MRLRIATFNLENWDDNGPGAAPTLARRIQIMQPLLVGLDAHVLCLQEVHGQEDVPDQPTFRALDALLADTPYATYKRAATAFGGQFPLQRRLVVLVDPSFTVQSTEEHAPGSLIPVPKYGFVTAPVGSPDRQPHDLKGERPIFQVDVGLPDHRVLHVLNVHLKSRIPTNIDGQTAQVTLTSGTGHQFTVDGWASAAGFAEGILVSSIKRVGQALEARVLIDKIFTDDPASGRALVVICGDFNAGPDDVPVQAIVGAVEDTLNPALIDTVMVSCAKSVAESRRYTLIHQGKGEQFDHILVSRALAAGHVGTTIQNLTLHDESAAFATDDLFPESDHAPVVSEFNI